MAYRFLVFLLPLALGACVSAGRSGGDAAAPHGVALENGRWFDGEQFLPRTFYVVDGRFTGRRPQRVDSVIELGGAFIVPPFGDAHTHNLDGPFNLDRVRNAYVAEGTFYVQVLTNSQRRASSVREQFNRPGALDVVYAHGGLTSTLSHPFQAYEPFAMGINNPAQWRERVDEIRRSRILENDAYWFIDSLPDLEEKWPRILAGNPDLLKIFLLDASNPEGRRHDPFNGPGLDPALVPEIVRRAHAAGLRVAAHVETTEDMEIALAAGVNILAHLPGYGLAPGEAEERYRLSESLARRVARQQVVMMPNAFLVMLTSRALAEGDTMHVARTVELQRRNLRLLREHDVILVVGSDAFGRTARGELYAMRDLGLWTNRELLSIWSEATPRSIFPGRPIGRLQSGYEASLLALGCDPLERLECVEEITLRIKQGVVVPPPTP